MIEEYKDTVKVVSKNYPLPMHSYSRSAAAAALTAYKMGKFREVHHALYENMKELDDEKVREIVTAQGLDPDDFLKIMESAEIQEQIDQDIIDGEKAEVRGTPTVFINGRLQRQRSFEDFQDTINTILFKKK